MEQLQKLIDEYVKWTQENRMAGKRHLRVSFCFGSD